MVRTQIALDEEDHRALKREAAERSISLAEAVRRIVQEHLRAGSVRKRFRKRDYLSIVGMGASGKRDVAVKHDRYIGSNRPG